MRERFWIMAYSCYEENGQQTLCVTSWVVLLESASRAASKALEVSSHPDTNCILGSESCMFGTHAGGGLVVLTRHPPALLNLIVMLQKTNTHV